MATAFTFGSTSSVSSNTQNDAKKFELELLKNKTELSKSQIEFKKFEIELTKSNIELEKAKEVTKVKQLDVSLAKIQANKENEDYIRAMKQYNITEYNNEATLISKSCDMNSDIDINKVLYIKC